MARVGRDIAMIGVAAILGASAGAGCGPAVAGAQESGTAMDSTGDTATADEVDPCEVSPAPTGCLAGIDAWFFHPAFQRCRKEWTGCGPAPFASAEACASACEPCEAFTEPSTFSPPPRPVVVRNGLSIPVWLMGHQPTDDAVGFRDSVVRFAGPTDVPLVTAPNACDVTCPDMLASGCVWGCSDAGPAPGPIMIEPGGTFRQAVRGLHLQPLEVPLACAAASCPGASSVTCGRDFALPDHPTDVYVDVALLPPCGDADTCECTPDSDGSCRVPPLSGTADFPERRRATAVSPDETLIEI